MNRYRTFGIVAIIVLVVVAVFAASPFWQHSGVYRVQSGGFLNQTSLESVNLTSPNVYVYASNSTVYINGSADLPVMMGPMNAPSMYSFEILGLINPTLLISQGALVNFTVVNVDTDSYHNFVLSHSGPPYYNMGNMMQGYGMMYSMGYLPPVHSGSYAYTNISYEFSSPGTYWYLCTYPGHAANGMYGKIVVS